MNNNNHRPRNILITGGAGFIGCRLVHYMLQSDPAIKVVAYDALTYAGSMSNLQGLQERFADRYIFIHANICDHKAVNAAFTAHQIDTVVHLAAETHVDRSITDPSAFLQTNIIGTYTLLDAACNFWGKRRDVRFHHVSTDEVYGSLETNGLFAETSPYDPSSPYSASKAGSDHLVRAWNRTYHLPVTISNCSNNYGPNQFPEKLIPLMINNAIHGKPLPVYGDGANVRDWLYVEDHCRALDAIVRFGADGRTYNVGAGNELTNIEMVRLLCSLLEELRPPGVGKHYSDLITFVQDRPGHDKRYAIDASRLRNELKWTPQYDFQTGLKLTIQWYLDNQDWLDGIYAQKYRGERLGMLNTADASTVPSGGIAQKA